MPMEPEEPTDFSEGDYEDEEEDLWELIREQGRLVGRQEWGQAV